MVDTIERLDIEDILEAKRITPKTPLVKQIERKSDRYNWIFEKNNMDF
jgi:hypothetical protein